VIIAQISDTHIVLDTPDAERRLRDFENTIADLNALNPAPDVIFHTGDVVHNGRPDEYAEAARILAKARAPVYVLAGNKDNRANLRAAFSDRGYLARDAEFIDYTVEEFPVRLIAVDTLNTASNKGDFCEVRAKRLIDMIDAEPTKPIAVFAHHPPYEVQVGPDPINFETVESMVRLQRAVQHSGRIAAVFCGHVHRGTAGQIGTTPVLVVPCIATTLRKGDYPAPMKTRPVYYIHCFDSDGTFTTAARIVATETCAAL
jgi:Icc protein